MSVTYHVTITASGATGNGVGFIDRKTTEQYGTAVTMAQAQVKKRGNFRYEQILDTLAMMANVSVANVFTTGATATAEGTTFEMDVTFASGASVYVVREEEAIVGVLAVRRLIAEALSTERTRVCDVFDDDGSVVFTGDLVVGKMAADLTAALALITVTPKEE